MTRLLFICGKNQLRSPTAEQVFASYPGIETDSAGVNHDAGQRVSAEQVRWADTICVMERRHATKLRQQHRAALDGKRVVCLDIPDDYAYMDPALVALLERRAERFLPRA